MAALTAGAQTAPLHLVTYRGAKAKHLISGGFCQTSVAKLICSQTSIRDEALYASPSQASMKASPRGDACIQKKPLRTTAGFSAGPAFAATR